MTDSRPLRILQHCVNFPPLVGGLESHVFYLCRALAEMGHTVDIVTARSLPDTPTHETMDGVGVHRTWSPGRNPVGWGLHALGSVPTTRRLAAEADILHAQAFASVPPAVAARGVRGAPVVATWHTSHFLKRADSPFWRPIFRRMIASVDHNLAASVEIAEVGERIAPGRRIEPLTNGVETDIFRPVEPTLDPPPAGRRRLVVPRRLVHKNGVEYAVRALPLIAADVEMVFVGDGPERSRLEALAAELGVTERARFLGTRPNAVMPGILSSAELAVVPSLMEATSVAALECMSCELPVAASNVGGLPEIVSDRVGGLFEPANPEDLARVVTGLLDAPDLAERGRRAREIVVAHWSNRRLAERHLEIYRELLARRRSGTAATGASR